MWVCTAGSAGACVVCALWQGFRGRACSGSCVRQHIHCKHVSDCEQRESSRVLQLSRFLMRPPHKAVVVMHVHAVGICMCMHVHMSSCAPLAISHCSVRLHRCLGACAQSEHVCAAPAPDRVQLLHLDAQLSLMGIHMPASRSRAATSSVCCAATTPTAASPLSGRMSTSMPSSTTSLDSCGQTNSLWASPVSPSLVRQAFELWGVRPRF